MATETIHTAINETFEGISKERKDYHYSMSPREVGYVKSVSSGIVKISGLPGAGYEELLKFPNGLFGIAYNIDAG